MRSITCELYVGKIETRHNGQCYVELDAVRNLTPEAPGTPSHPVILSFRKGGPVFKPGETVAMTLVALDPPDGIQCAPGFTESVTHR